MCFEQPHHKWLLETHVASRYGAVTRAEFVPWFLTTTKDTNLWHKSLTGYRISDCARWAGAGYGL